MRADTVGRVVLVAASAVVCALMLRRRRSSSRCGGALLTLPCSMCRASLPHSAFNARQVRRGDHQRKCRRCIETFDPSAPRPHASKPTRPPPPNSTAAAEDAACFDSTTDPLRLARKAETVLRARLDRFVLVLDHCCDDLNHVAVLRSCEALGVMRVWLVDEQTAAYAHDGEGGSGAQQAGPRSRRRLAERAKQRGFAQEKLLGLRRAQLYCTWLDVRTFGDVDSCVRALRADGRQIWATDLSQQAVPLTSEVSALRAELPLRLAIVLGAEGLGVSPSFLRAADRRVFLPMYGMSESFNVSVAAALVMQRLCDACAADRGRLPAAELDETRRRWYRALARNEEQRRAFDALADAGGAAPFVDTRRPQAFRDESRLRLATGA